MCSLMLTLGIASNELADLYFTKRFEDGRIPISRVWREWGHEVFA